MTTDSKHPTYRRFAMQSRANLMTGGAGTDAGWKVYGPTGQRAIEAAATAFFLDSFDGSMPANRPERSMPNRASGVAEVMRALQAIDGWEPTPREFLRRDLEKKLGHYVSKDILKNAIRRIRRRGK